MKRVTLRDVAMTATWHDVEKLLYHTVHRFMARHGGDYDEYMGLVHFCFMRAYGRAMAGTLPRKKGKFSTWLVFSLWHECLETLRHTIKRQTRLPTVFLQPDEHGVDGLAHVAAKRRPEFKLLDFVRDLSGDAQDVVLITVNYPTADATSSQIRRGVKRFLRALGWKNVRIAAAFTEIGDALRSR